MRQRDFRVCPVCEVSKHIDQFHKQGTSKTGRRRDCKDCRSKSNQRNYQSNRKQRIRQIREWEKRNPDKVKFYSRKKKYARRNAKGFFFNEQLEARMALYGNKCWICSRPANSIDHVKPLSRGGSNWPSNLRPCCAECNSKKNNYWPAGPMEQKMSLIISKVVGSSRRASLRKDPLETGFGQYIRKMIVMGYFPPRPGHLPLLQWHT